MRELLGPQQIQSLLVVPVMIEGTWWGFLGFDDCRSPRGWSEAEVSILLALAGSIGGAIARRRSEARLQHESVHDALTGLPNRTLFQDRVDRCIERARRKSDYAFAVLFMDLDR